MSKRRVLVTIRLSLDGKKLLLPPPDIGLTCILAC